MDYSYRILVFKSPVSKWEALRLGVRLILFILLGSLSQGRRHFFLFYLVRGWTVGGGGCVHFFFKSFDYNMIYSIYVLVYKRNKILLGFSNLEKSETLPHESQTLHR